MCHADVAFYSAKWIADSHQRPSKKLRSNSQITCANWRLIDDWARERALKEHEFYLRPGPFETNLETNV